MNPVSVSAETHWQFRPKLNFLPISAPKPKPKFGRPLSEMSNWDPHSTGGWPTWLGSSSRHCCDESPPDWSRLGCAVMKLNSHIGAVTYVSVSTIAIPPPTCRSDTLTTRKNVVAAESRVTRDTRFANRKWRRFYWFHPFSTFCGNYSYCHLLRTLH